MAVVATVGHMRVAREVRLAFMCALVMAIVGRISTMTAVSTLLVMECVSVCCPTILLVNGFLESPRSEMTPRVHGDDLGRISPLRKRANCYCRLGIGEIGPGVKLYVRLGAGSTGRGADLCSMSNCLLATARA